jgi:hypothetical protein
MRIQRTSQLFTVCVIRLSLLAIACALWSRKDGAGSPVEYGAMPVPKNGEIIGAVVSFSDITLRKTLEDAPEQAKPKRRKPPK